MSFSVGHCSHCCDTLSSVLAKQGHTKKTASSKKTDLSNFLFFIFQKKIYGLQR